MKEPRYFGQAKSMLRDVRVPEFIEEPRIIEPITGGVSSRRFHYNAEGAAINRKLDSLLKAEEEKTECLNEN